MSILIWVVAGALAGIAVWALARWKVVRPLECGTARGFGGFLGGAVTAVLMGRPMADFELLTVVFAIAAAAGFVAIFGGIAERELPHASERLSSGK